MIPFFPASCLIQVPYLVKFTSRNLKSAGTGTLSVCICIYNNKRHGLMKKVSFCSSFNALSTDTSFIKIVVCYQISTTGSLATTKMEMGMETENGNGK